MNKINIAFSPTIPRQLIILKGIFNLWCSKPYAQRAGIAAGGIFYNVQPGTAAQLKI